MALLLLQVETIEKSWEDHWKNGENKTGKTDRKGTRIE